MNDISMSHSRPHEQLTYERHSIYPSTRQASLDSGHSKMTNFVGKLYMGCYIHNSIPPILELEYIHYILRAQCMIVLCGWLARQVSVTYT